MALPILLVGRAWRLLRIARSVLRAWQALPPDRRGDLRGSMQRLGSLVVELTGALAAERRQKRGGRALGEIVGDVGSVLDELRLAAPELAPVFAPRSRRGRIAMRAVAGVGAATRRRAERNGGASDDEATGDLDALGDDRELEALASEFAGLGSGEAPLT